jgi:hypothetical protein
MKINYSLLQRLTAKRAGKYKSPFRKGGMFQGTPHKSGGYWLRWSETPEDWSELKGLADEIIRLDHTGWFVDSYQSESQSGIVREVKTKNGPLYLACISDPFNGDKKGNGPCRIECREDGSPYWYDCEREAARNADGAAEASAEEMREWSEQADERQQAEEAADEMQAAIKTARKEARELIAGIRQSTLAPSLCQRMRREVARLREESREAWEKLREARETMERLKAFA